MRTVRIIGSTLAVGVLLSAAACSSGSSGGTSPAASGSNVQKSASITIVANALPSGLDPDSTNATDSGIEQLVTTNYMGMLYSDNGVTSAAGQVPTPKPDLASGGSASADGKTWTISLRPNVKSSAGNLLTAADVVWTFDRMEHAKSTGASCSQINVNPADPATAVNASTVALHLTAPSALVPTILSLPFTGIIDATAAKPHATAADPYATTWLNKNTASFGPYTVASITPASSIVLVSNPNYWQGAPKSVTKATFRVIQDASTTLQTALTGQSDMTITLPYSDLATLKKSSVVDVHNLPVPSTVYMTLDEANPSLTNPLVRQAINLATDRTAISDTVYGGTAIPTTGCLPAQLTTAKTPNDNGVSPEVAQAKALLAQVPGKHTLAIGVLPSAFPEGATIARIVQSNLEAVGIDVTLKTYSSFGPIVADAKSHKIGSLVLEQAPFVPDAGYFFKAFFLGGSPYNFSSYNDPAFNTATNAAMAEPDPARQTQIATACALFTKDAPADMLVESGNILVTKKDIGNVQSFADIDPRLFNLTVS